MNDKYYNRFQCALPGDCDVRSYPCTECDCSDHDHEFDVEYKREQNNCHSNKHDESYREKQSKLFGGFLD